jgi:biotin transport system substrate-specific component
MLRTIQISRTNPIVLRLLGIALFVALMAISAKISFNFGEIPFTMQVLVVLLSGFVLGSRDAAMSQSTYLASIAAGLPIDSRGLGTGVFASPSWGYLIGFIVAAFVVGWLAEHGAKNIWQRFAASVLGILIIYAIGVPVLKMMIPTMDWQAAWTAGAAPFFFLDLGKAAMAIFMVEDSRKLLMRDGLSTEEKPQN